MLYILLPWFIRITFAKNGRQLRKVSQRGTLWKGLCRWCWLWKWRKEALSQGIQQPLEAGIHPYFTLMSERKKCRTSVLYPQELNFANNPNDHTGDSPLEPPGRNIAFWHLGFSLMRPILDFWPNLSLEHNQFIRSNVQIIWWLMSLPPATWHRDIIYDF